MKLNEGIIKIVALALIQSVILCSEFRFECYAADTLSPRCEINSNDFLRGFLGFSKQSDKNQGVCFLPHKKSRSKGRAITTGLFSKVLNGCMDMFFFFFPHRSIVSRIKENYPGQKINVLDVGTGEGGFVEKFQKLLDEREIYAEVIGIDINPTRISQGLSLGRNIKVCDVSEAEEIFGARSFDIITINAPDRDIRDIVRFCMRLLKDNGMLIVRLHNDIHYQVHFGRQYRENLIENLQDDFNVESLPWHILDLPKGEYYFIAFLFSSGILKIKNTKIMPACM
ncbi:MAG: class I SAM-dependent methyltransferase [Candidatus Omnitrophica bacterium]|nr:class I SAM-dependent methyltransferase [Candidatus Omnitrophota bacterium]